MEKQKSSLVISIIALVVSVIALIIALVCCPCKGRCHKHHHHPQPPMEAPVAPPAMDDSGNVPPAPSAAGGEEVSAPIPNPDGTVKRQPATAPFVDLGLPSGTKWRTINEPDMLTYEEAVKQFDKQLPTRKQFAELQEKCEWKAIKEGGYKVIGPNGKFVIFPYAGFINCTGEFRGKDKFGEYWTATMKGSEEAYRLSINDNGVKIAPHSCCYARSIRLVEK